MSRTNIFRFRCGVGERVSVVLWHTAQQHQVKDRPPIDTTLCSESVQEVDADANRVGNKIDCRRGIDI